MRLFQRQSMQMFRHIKLQHTQAAMFARVGFIGLGNMGLPMAANLVKNGHEVLAYDPNQSVGQKALKLKIDLKTQLEAVTKSVQLFITMLPNSSNSVQVCVSSSGIFNNAPRNSLIIDCSTISPATAADLNKKAQAHAITYVDAPVSGGVTGAAQGTLSFMVGAQNQEIYQRCKPLLECMGKKFFNCGYPSAGQATKICNNVALATQMMGICQALALGKSLGMDPKKLVQVMRVSTANCWSLEHYCPVPGVMENVPASRNYTNGFGCELMAKDLNLGIEAAKQNNVSAPFSSVALEIYKTMIKMGHGKNDFGIVYEMFQPENSKPSQK